MIEIKFQICDEVVYFNTAAMRFEKGVVKGIQVVPTGISTDEEGRRRLDGCEVLYSLESGLVLTAAEAFATEEDARDHYTEYFCKR